MAKKAKKGKNRLDKFYHLAKEAGYRSRAAFKLIQLNRKYGFLEKAKVLIDLCAAPGGWLQVAEKYMPQQNALIVGVDLAPIKPVPRCLTFVEDITTEKCKQTLRRELRDWKADVVLHDGAPNVGTSWTSDAYAQNVLTLSSLKLASQFLRQGGTFVTKIFRSRDYNSLLWAVQQLFTKVEATKPESSRQVSAEIFLVCTGFKPATSSAIDARLLDPNYVFKDVDDADAGEGNDPDAEQKGRILNDLIHPEKHRRHRSGYADGDYTLYHPEPVREFILSSDALSVLARASALTFPGAAPKPTEPPSDDADALPTVEELLARAPQEIRDCCDDLRVLGKKEFRVLLRWREELRKAMQIGKYRKKEEKEEGSEAPKDDEERDEAKLEEDATAESSQLHRSAARLRKQAMERKRRAIQRMNLGMQAPEDIGLEFGGVDVGALEVDFGQGESPPSDDEDNKGAAVSESSDEEESASEDEDGVPRHLGELDEELEAEYDEFLARRRAADVKSVVEERRRKQKEGLEDKPAGKNEEWWGIDDDKRRAAGDESSDSDSESDVGELQEENEYVDEMEEDVEEHETAPARPLSKKAQKFFSNPIFSALDEVTKDLTVKKGTPRGAKRRIADTELHDDDAKADVAISDRAQDAKRRKKEKRPKKGRTEQGSDDEDGSSEEKKPSKDDFEIVPQEPEAQVSFSDAEDDDGPSIKLDTAEALTLAHSLLRPSGRAAAIDATFNRYSFNDPKGSLPSWFSDDERKHNRPTLPVSKEAMEILKQRMKGVNDRTIKKVAEAKARKKLRAAKKVEKLRKEMGKVWEDDDPSATTSSKVTALKKLSRKISKAGVEKREKPKLVVAKGVNRGVKGRPKGIKGRYKMVDGVMKKEMRAQKRHAKANKGRKRR
ncbi:FtsJ-domain-containing protein [Gonapodya prolifera JEL478]|uniref:FtsJ-domain-containing protein n=1 Tax=Gonapodya prolifera (strain JEL478) TaxID=1344416 RepID=A0A139A8V8_GONPJ|nr:FtsJ-domain-containing protein [Gonapodya prolifera JEL478]|eukprot:KXS12833.1 FtsJ-domain-containing protein [Gonapodya prolifera JEL478]